MISIIICSRNSTLLPGLENNIRSTIGVDYEIIPIDNSANKFSIFSAYNKGVELSKNPITCFIHEDIIFHTKNWGETICRHLEDPKCGIIGVCGGKSMPRIPSSWSFNDIAAHFIQSDKDNNKSKLLDLGDYNGKSYTSVIALDGLFLCSRKEIFRKIQFDDTRFKGFHFYDIDICLQAIANGYENRSVNDILIEHFSCGSPNKQWIENSMIYYEKWKPFLPIYTNDLQIKGLEKQECHYMENSFLNRMVRSSYSSKEIFDVITHYLNHIPSTHNFSFRNSLKFKIFLALLIKNPSSFVNDGNIFF